MLDLVLGSHPRFIGLGEIYQVIRTDIQCVENNTFCSCGQIYHQCPFWGEVTKGLQNYSGANLKDRYRYVIKQVDRLYGRERAIIDSSKMLGFFKSIHSIDDIDCQVVYLIRDVRAWTISRLTKRHKRPKYYQKNGAYEKRLAHQYGPLVRPLAWLLPFLTRMPSYYFLVWYMQNKTINRYLKNNQVAHIQVGYDELALNPEMMMNAIEKFLGIKSEIPGLSATLSESHILIGNTRKSDPRRRQGIFYDNRWMYRNEWVRAAAMMPFVMRYNAENVYQTARQKSIWTD
jgi:hypothetical protein